MFLNSPPKQIQYRDDTWFLILRPLEENDAKAIYEALELNRKNLLKFMDWAHQELTLDAQRERIKKSRESYFKGEEYEMGVFDGQSSEFMMGTGWHPGKCLNKRALEMGYWTVDKFRNRGLATLITKILTVVAFEYMNSDRMEIRCNKDNKYSTRVIKNCGFHFEGEVPNYSSEPTHEMIQNGYATERIFLQFALTPQDKTGLPWYRDVKERLEIEQ